MAIRDETRMLLESMNRLFEDKSTKQIIDAAETGVFAGGWVAMIKGAGARGWMMILSAFLVAILGIALMSDPVTLMYGEHGLLAGELALPVHRARAGGV